MSRSRRRPRPPRIEELEPRILFAADAAALGLGPELLQGSPSDQRLIDAPSTHEQGDLASRLLASIALDEPATLHLNAGTDAPASTTPDTPAAPLREIIFMDAGVADREQLLAAFSSSAEVVFLDAGADGLAQITDFLAGRHDIDAVHLVSHGSDGQIRLGNTILDAERLGQEAARVAAWGRALSSDADLLIYGCDVAATPAGLDFMNRLATLTGADVAASDDLTGAAIVGGNWTLEQHTGSIQATSLSAPAWQGVLSVVPVGGETLVNTTTTGVQTTMYDNRHVAMDANGNFVVVWQDASGIDGGGIGVYGQRYNAAGVAQGGQFRINTHTNGDQSEPQVAMDASGKFVVVWQSMGQDGSNLGVYAQRYDAAGVAQGAEFRVNTTTLDNQGHPALAMDASGNFVVTWAAFNQDATNSWGIYAQRYNAAGVAQGGEFHVGSSTANDQSEPAVAMDATGNFVVTWMDAALDGSGNGIYAQRYNASGVAQGAEFRVNTTTANAQEYPSVAMDANGFIVVWDSNGQDGSGYGVYGQRYDAAGVAQGGEFQINTTTSNNQWTTSVALTAHGGFVVSWTSDNQDGSSAGIYLRQFDANGTALTGEVRANTTTANSQDNASLAADTRGHLVVVWTGQGSGDVDGVFLQRYTVPGVTVTPTSGLTTTEAGGQASFTVVLDSAPAANVTIAVSVSNALEASVSTALLTFTAANWNIAQTVTVTGLDDTLDDGDRAYAVVLAAASSADAAYNGLNPDDVALTNTDNDTRNTVFVTTTADTADGDTSSLAALMGNRGADGQISLREAIAAANNTTNGSGGADRIQFAISGTGVHTLRLGSVLPSITTAMEIDASTDDSFAAQGNRPAIVLSGDTNNDGTGDVATGLTVLGAGANGSTVRGLIFQRFTSEGLALAGSDGNTVAGNWFGLDANGTAAAGNWVGLNVWNANNNLIGGSTAADRNVLSGNASIGIVINTNAGTSTGNLVRGNYVGTNAAGTAAVGNTAQGLWVNAANNTIGGTVAGQGNVISGTTSWVGLDLTAAASGTLVAGNLIGLNAAGTAALGNTGGGVTIASANNTIGGTAAAARNVISGNLGFGLRLQGAAATGNVVIGNYIGTDATGTLDVNGSTKVDGRSGIVLDNGASNNRIGTNADGVNDAAERNVISGNNWFGLEFLGAGTSGNLAQGNYIGTDVTGLVALGNANGGVSFWNGVTNNQLGSGLTGAGNVISGNETGVLLANGVSGNKMQGNLIGLGADGSTVVANTGVGVYAYNGGSTSLVTGNVIGTDADGSRDAAERNVISGNYRGIAFQNAEVTGNTIAGNVIGTDATGALDRGNTQEGVYLFNGAHANTVGGSLAAQANVISGNDQEGVQIDGEASDNNIVRGNRIGVNAAGTATVGNGGDGIYISGGADGTLIGGTGASEGNWVAGNGIVGIEVDGASTGTVIQGNRIGTDLAGTANWGHQQNGVLLENGATGTLVGGTTAASANLIAFSGQGGVWDAGIAVSGNASTGNAFLRNSIYSSVGLGIDLGSDGVTPNDAGDTDTGPNDLLNALVISSATTTGSELRVAGAYSGAANTYYRVEVYSNTSAEASGTGEGRTYLGTVNIPVGAGGTVSGSYSFATAVAAGAYISATVTRTDATYSTFYETSEFSNQVQARAPGITITPPSGSLVTTEAGGTAAFTVVLDAAPTANVTVAISSSDATEGSVSTTLLTFTAANWNVAQTVTVTGVDDSLVDGAVAYSVVTGAASSADAAYQGLNASDVAISNTDNDTVNTVVVTTTADTADGDTSSLSALMANQGADGQISLREAITAANNTTNGSGGADRIHFDITDPLVGGAHTITLNSDLGTITDAVVIDGSTEPDASAGAPRVVLDGNASASVGLHVQAGNTTLRGLVIERFTGRGIYVDNGASNVSIVGNYIGTDVTGLLARGNGAWGIDLISAGSGVVIGGPTAADRNVIGGNTGQGGIAVNNTPGVTIVGNSIGVGADGVTALGNGNGILLLGTTTGTRIGGTTSAEGNLIAHNSGDGVALWTAGTEAAVVGNRIFDNGAQGIDLGWDGAVQANDAGDADSGPNGLQNYPVLSAATVQGSQITIDGTLNSAANGRYRIEFFASPSGDASGHGEGQVLLGYANVATDGSGNASFHVTLTATVAAGSLVSATATVSDATYTSLGSTSEFAANVTAVAGSGPANTVPAAQTVNEDAPLVFSSGTGNAVTVSDGVAGDGRVRVTLTVTQGTLTLAQTTGLSFVSGANGSATMVVDGLESAVNAAMNGMVYVPSLNYNGSANLQVTTALSASLQGHYSFDAGTAADVSAGTAQNGSFVGNATTVVDGIRGTVLSLDGSGDAVQIAGTFGNPTAVTLGAWVNFSGAGRQELISLNDRVHIALDDGGLGVKGSIQTAAGAWADLSSGISLSGTGWHHVMYTYDDAADQHTLYIDGAVVASATVNSSIYWTGATTTYIGQHPLGTNWLNGRVDDARIYDRALTTAEVANLAADRSSDTDTVVVTVAAVNDAPAGIVVSLFPTINEDEVNSNGRLVSELTATTTDADAGALVGIAVYAVDNTHGQWQYTLDGSLWTDITGVSDSHALLLPSDALSRVRFVPQPDYNGVAFPFSYRAWDQTTGSAGGFADASVTGGSTAFSTAAGSVSTTVLAVNDAPVNGLPGAQVTPVNTALVFSSGNGNALSVADIDAGAAPLQVTLSVVHGSLTLAATTGLSFSVGDGASDASMTFTGTVSAINTALNGLRYTPTAAYQGSDTLSLSTSDQGNTGSGGALSDSDTLSIQVGALRFQEGVNGYTGTQDTWVSTSSASTNHGAEATVVADDNSGSDAALLRFDNVFGGGVGQIPLGSTITGATLSIYVTHGDSLDTVALHRMLSAWTEASTYNSLVTGVQTNGTEAGSSALLSFDAGTTGWVTLSGAQLTGAVQAWANGEANHGFAFISHNADLWTFASSENGSSNLRPYLSINHVPPQAPVVTGSGGSASYTENAAATAVDPGLTLTDADSGTLSGATVQISAGYANGQDVLAFTNQSGITGSWDAGTGTLTLSGSATVAQYQAALRSVTYANTSDDPSTAARTIAFTASDAFTTSVAATRSLNVLAVNDAPTDIDLASPAGTNLLANGSFETNTTPANSIGFESSLNGWTAIGGEGFEVWTGSFNNPTEPGPAAASDGSARLELDNGAALNGIAQTVSTQAGQAYVLSFDLSHRSGTASSSVEVYWRGVLVGRATQTTVGWQTYSVVVTGSGGADELRLMEASAENDTVGTHLDNVRLVAARTPVLAVAEGSPNGTVVARAGGADLDAAGNLSYSLTNDAGGRFAIDATSGLITVANGSLLDHESAAAHAITVRVTDAGGLFREESFSLSVSNVNEAPSALAVARYLSNETPLAFSGYTYNVNIDHGGAALQLEGVTYAQGLSLHPGPSGTGDTRLDYAVNNAGTFRATIGINDYQAGDYGSVVMHVLLDGLEIYTSPILSSLSDPIELSLNVGGGSTLSLVVDNAGNGNAFDHAIWANARLEGGSVALATVPEGAANGTVVGNVVGVDPDHPDNWTYTLVDSAGGRFAIDAVTGRLTVANGSLLDFEAAPSHPITVRATDAGGLSVDQLFTVLLSNVNEAPSLSTTAVSLSYNENAGAVPLDPGLSVGDVDSATLSGATVQITAGYANGEDVLAFTNQSGITGAWNASTGTLTLSGNATVAQYQAALRSVTYANGSENPSTLARTVEFSVSDGLASTQATRGLNVTAVNDAPVLGFISGNQNYTENAGPVVISASSTISDLDSPDFAGGRIVVGFTANGQAEDRLAVRHQGTGAGQIGVSGSVVSYGGVAIGSLSGGNDGSTPLVITLNGNATQAAVQALARNLTYENVSDSPSSLVRTVQGWVEDGDGGTSNLASGTLTMVATNDAPTLVDGTALGLSSTDEDTPSFPVQVNTLLFAAGTADADNTVLQGLALTGVTGRGTWQYSTDGSTWTSVGTVSGSQALLLDAASSLRYVPDGVDGETVGFSFRAWDQTSGTASSFGARSTANPGAGGGSSAFSLQSASASRVVTPVNDAPTLSTSPGSLSYNENAGPQAVDPGLSLGDIDSATLSGATVQITTAYANGEDVLAFTDHNGITGTWDAGTGTLTLSGNATVAQYQAALRSVTYANGSEAPSILVRTVSLRVSDGSLDSAIATRQVQVVSINDAPSTADVSATGAEDAASIAITLTGSDVDGTVDRFRLNTLPAHGALYLDAGLTTLAATGTDYAASGQALTLYFVPVANWNGSTSFSFVARDTLGSTDATPATATLTVTPVNDAPVAVGESYTVAEDGTLTLPAPGVLANDSDVDGDTLQAAAVTLPSHAATFNFTTAGNIVYTPVANFVGTDSFTYLATDGALGSTIVTVTFTVTAVNDAPVLAHTALGATVNEDMGLVIRVSDLLGGASDVDGPAQGVALVGADTSHGTWSYSLNAGATWTVVGSVDAAHALLLPDDGANSLLYFAPQADWNGSLPAALTLRAWDGSSGIAGAQADTTANGGASAYSSATDDFSLNVSPVNDAPTVATTVGSLSYNENAGPQPVDPGLSAGDVDSATLSGATVQITTAYANGEDVLGFTDQNGITGNWDASTGTLTLSGSASVAQYQAALRSVTYTNTSEAPSILVRTVSFTVTDGSLSSNTSTRQVQVASWNDAPTTSDGSSLAAEDTGSMPITLSGQDVDGTVLGFRLSSLPTNGNLYLDAAHTQLAATGIDYSATAQALTLYFAPAAGWHGSTSFQYTAVDNTGFTDASPATGTFIVSAVNDAPTGTPVIVGSATEDQTLSVDTSGIADADGLGAFSVQWLRDGVAIGGATAATYTLGDADVGANLSVRVSYTDGDGTAESLTSAAIGPVANVNDAPTGAPVITGSATEDQTLTVDTSSLADADGLGAYAYQWLRNGVAVSGATGSSYLLGDADVGATMSVQVSYTDGHGGAESLTSAATSTVANVNDAPTGLPIIVGTSTENQTLTVDTSGIADADGLGAFTLQWLRNGVAVSGATAATYTLGDADVGAAMSVQVTYTDGQGTPESIASAATGPVANVNDAPTGTPVIVGTPTEDQTLTLDTSALADDDGLGAFTVQWLRDGVAVSGATGSSYLLGDVDVGATMSVQVSYTDGHGSAESLTSAATSAVANVNDAPTGLPVIVGTPTEDQTLTVDTSALADDDGLGAFTLQWLRNGVAIGGATTATYTLGDADVGATMSVQVSYTDGHGGAESLTSAATSAVANVNDAPTGLPVIVGTSTEDQTLTLDTSGIADADGLGAFTLQWLRNGVAIGGATATTYTLGDADVGASFSVTVNYTDAQGTAESITSAAVGPVANVNDAPTGAPVIVGIATEDQTLTVDTSGIADADGLGAFTLQWLRNGAAVSGATAATYTLGDADVGAAMSVQVTYTDGQGTPESIASAATGPVANVNDAPTGTPVIVGTPTEDQTLTLDTSALADDDGLGAFTVQWLRNGVAVSGATGSSYLLGDADVGATMSVQVSYTDGHGSAESLTSAATSAVANVNDAPTGAPVIVGTPTEDQTLTVDTSSIADADGLGAFTLQWLRNGVAVSGATATTYTLGDADVGATMSVQVTYTDGQGTAEAIIGPSTAPVANVNDAPQLAMPLADQTTDQGQAFDFTLPAGTFTDIDPGDALTLSASGLPAWLHFDASSGRFTGTPGNADVGRLTLTVRATDLSGAFVEAQFQLQVLDVNDAPQITSDGGGASAGVSVDEHTTAVTTVTSSDLDGDAPSYRIVGGADAARFQIDAQTGVVSLRSAPDFERPDDANQDHIYHLIVGVDDGRGGSASQDLVITVRDINEAPTTSDTSATTDEDTPLALHRSDFGFHDVDAGSRLQAIRVTVLPQGGTLSLDGHAVAAGQLIDAQALDAGRLVFTPDADANGEPYTTLQYRVTDGALESGTAQLSVRVRAVDDPTEMGVAATTAMDTHNTITLGSAALWLRDVDTDVAALHIQVLGVDAGVLERVDAPGVPVTQFTLKDLEDGRLRFVADSSGKSPWMDVSVEGGPSQRMRFLLQSDGGTPTPPTTTPPPTTPSGPTDPGTDPSRPAPSPRGPDPLAPATRPAASLPAAASVDGETLGSVSMEPTGAGTMAAARASAAPSPSAGDTSTTPRSAWAGRTGEEEAGQAVQLDLPDPDLQRLDLTSIQPGNSARKDEEGSAPIKAPLEKLLDSLRAAPGQAAAVVLSAGFVWWSLRAAGLVASLLASTPVWRHLDPIPILSDDENDEAQPVPADRDPAPDGDADEAGRDEAASRELLDGVRPMNEERT